VRIAALVKPIRDVRAASTDPERAWRAEPEHLVLNPFCRRAVAQACELAAAVGDGTVTVVALGPAAAERVVREAMAAAAESDVACDGLLLDDPTTDPVEVARLLADALLEAGGCDLVLTGRRGVDEDGGHIGAQVAARLALPFVGPARYLSLQRSTLHVRCQLDDGWAQASVELPAVVSCAERLIEPSSAPVSPRAPEPVTRRGPTPSGDPTRRRPRRVAVHPRPPRDRRVLDGPSAVAQAVEQLATRGALGPHVWPTGLPATADARGDAIGVLVEPERVDDACDLLGVAARLREVGGHVVAIGPAAEPPVLGAWGADQVLRLGGSAAAEDVASAVVRWAATAAPVVVLATSTDWGREVAARTAVALDAALVADATGLGADGGGALRVESTVLAGQLLATTTVQERPAVVTVQPGAVPRSQPRRPTVVTSSTATVAACSRVHVRSRTRDAGLAELDRATVVVGVGLGVHRSDYPRLVPLLGELGAALACTRPVADRGWLPPGRQVGLTGRRLTPRLYVALGVWGAFEHLVGVAGAATILAVHPDRGAPVLAAADIGIVAEWADVVGPLAAALGAPGV